MFVISCGSIAINDAKTGNTKPMAAVSKAKPTQTRAIAAPTAIAAKAKPANAAAIAPNTAIDAGNSERTTTNAPNKATTAAIAPIAPHIAPTSNDDNTVNAAAMAIIATENTSKPAAVAIRSTPCVKPANKPNTPISKLIANTLDITGAASTAPRIAKATAITQIAADNIISDAAVPIISAPCV